MKYLILLILFSLSISFAGDVKEIKKDSVKTDKVQEKNIDIYENAKVEFEKSKVNYEKSKEEYEKAKKTYEITGIAYKKARIEFEKAKDKYVKVISGLSETNKKGK